MHSDPRGYADAVTAAPQPPGPHPSRSTPFVLVPGLGLGAESWRPTVCALREAGTVDVARTTTALAPGYGRRAGLDHSLAPADLATRLLDRLPGPCVVVAARGQVARHRPPRVPAPGAGTAAAGPAHRPAQHGAGQGPGPP
jgi:pimeloyl-ACP methyl ester carboxylesterase